MILVADGAGVVAQYQEKSLRRPGLLDGPGGRGSGLFLHRRLRQSRPGGAGCKIEFADRAQHGQATSDAVGVWVLGGGGDIGGFGVCVSLVAVGCAVLARCVLCVPVLFALSASLPLCLFLFVVHSCLRAGLLHSLEGSGLLARRLGQNSRRQVRFESSKRRCHLWR